MENMSDIIRRGDRVQHQDGRTGSATRDQFRTISKWDAVDVKWDDSTRPASRNRADKLTRIA
jgi:hypothetical protein